MYIEQKISPSKHSTLDFITMNRSSFMTIKSPSGAKKHHKISNEKVSKVPKSVSLFKWAGSKLHGSVFAQHLQLEVYNPSLFHNFKVSQGA